MTTNYEGGGRMSTYATRSTLRPLAERTDQEKASRYRVGGIVIALVGLMAAAASLIGNVVVADEAANADTLAWTFGLGTVGFAAVKLGIATMLIGILVRLWLRVDAVKAALPGLKPDVGPDDSARTGDIETAYGPATVTRTVPEKLAIHRMAARMWLPMIAMGPMLVAVGLVFAIVQSGETDTGTFTDLGALVQGTQFLGEGLILAGISFLLGTILSSLRSGGAEVQQALGVSIKTLKMPPSAKAFVGLMAAGVMVAMVQFVGYLVATGQDDPTSWFAWLGPVREFGLGLILSGIVLALYTIGTVLGFQFERLSQIIREGR
jgi:hypothetical protein